LLCSSLFQGLQCQERNLFLFNDLLLIAKERSSSHFKLKDQVKRITVEAKSVIRKKEWW
jgi:hypothetical protein